MRKIFLSAILMMASVLTLNAVNVTVTMNAASTTMSMAEKTTGTAVSVGEPVNKVYTFTANAGTYILTGYAEDTIVNGTIELTVSTDTAFVLQTMTVYATNKVEGVTFAYGTDYTVEPHLIGPDSVPAVITVGNSSTAGRATFLALKNSFCNVVIVPTPARVAEHFMPYYDTTKDRKITSNANIGASLPTWTEFTLRIPVGAQAQIAQKTADYVALTEIPFENIVATDSEQVYTYHLTVSKQYFYRVWGDNLYTQAGLLTAAAALDDIRVTAADMAAKSPKFINHADTANSKLNVADVFVNINPQGHLKMQVGDTKDILALRTWQLTNSSTANMYIDPDYHYTVLNLNGQEDTTVVKLERYTTSTDPWTTLTAVGNGTAIVLVTYDAIHLQQHSNTGAVTPYMGGYDWSAIWPENTGVFVVTVGNPESGIHSNMFANKGLNDATHKLAVDSLDAEHDVIYYLASKRQGRYTFKPEGVATVEIAYPTIGTNSASYTTFQNVRMAADSTYTLQLKEGRQIVRLTNAQGVSDYQVITAKPCTREITNLTRPEMPFRAGDKVAIQYSGLYHPNNKLSRIYNMTAYVTYNGAPAGTSEYGSAGQYTFAAVPSAQLYKYNVPLEAEGKDTLKAGCIQINGYGDPVGNHRNISRTEGRVYGGIAPSHKTYLGVLPDIELEVEGLKHHTVVFSGMPEGAVVNVMNDARDTLVADQNGHYDLILGAFTYSIEAENYAPLHSAFTVSVSQDDTIYIPVDMTLASAAWDGTTKTAPALAEGIYQIATGAELAWLADTVNASTEAIHAVLTADINLGGHNWTPIGSSSNPYLGTFDGHNYTVSGLSINASTTYQALFGKLLNGTIKNLTVEGSVTTSNTHAAGIVGGVEAGCLDNVHFRGSVITGKNNTGGIVGYVFGANAVVENASTEGYIYGAAPTGGIAGTVNVATDTVRNCYNWAFVSGTGTVGGIVGTCNANTTIHDVYNAGMLQMRSVTNMWGGVTTATTIGAICGLAAYGNLQNGYASHAYNNESNANNKTIVLGIDAMADGTLANIMDLGQALGFDPYPVLGSLDEIYHVTYIEFGKDTTEFFTNATELEEIWIDNVLGWYHNAQNDTVHFIFSDTTLYASMALKELTGAATFEERTLRPESAWYGDRDFVDDENYWNSGDYYFDTYQDNWGSSGIYFYDVTISNITETSFGWINPYFDQRSAAGHAAEGQNYAVWYNNWYGSMPVVLNEPAVISGMAVTNNAWVIDAILDGDGMSTEPDGSTGKPFGKGDWLRLTVTGYDEEEDPVGMVHFYLADFRDTVNYDWTYAENWQWLDLTELDSVNYLSFTLTSSKQNAYGMTTPAYFCFDNLGGQAADCQLGELTHVQGHGTGIFVKPEDNAAPQKVLRDGHIYIIRNGAVYDTAGRRIR